MLRNHILGRYLTPNLIIIFKKRLKLNVMSPLIKIKEAKALPKKPKKRLKK